MEVNVKLVTAKRVSCYEQTVQWGNKTEYAVTNQVVRSVTEVARYTKVRIRNDMMSGKL